MEFLAPFVAKSRLLAGWNVGISAPPSPSPERIRLSSVTLKESELLCAGKVPEAIRAIEIEDAMSIFLI